VGPGAKLSIGLALAAIILVVAALISAHRTSEQEFHTVADAAFAIRRDLPQGTSRQVVLSWLDRRRIQRTSNADQRQVIGLLHDVRKDAVSRSDLRMIFAFDDKDRLSTFLVEELTAARHGEERQEPLRD
jgi:hypothetical protein